MYLMQLYASAFLWFPLPSSVERGIQHLYRFEFRCLYQSMRLDARHSLGVHRAFVPFTNNVNILSLGTSQFALHTSRDGRVNSSICSFPIKLIFCIAIS